ncbi:uncharacterized protein RJT21DRAFT_118855, partial [Scheffersomyces amazonensis]|uniref:uncharacterized protein n=1 Tax=Scheffersomyces amazonensis TaxID=1078765 RepID=UPI00315D95FA
MTEVQNKEVIPPERYVGHQLRVILKDTRILDGVLISIDPYGNLLLGNTFETSTDKLNPDNLHTRDIGLVSIPKDTMNSIRTDKQTYKKIFNH